MESDRTFWLGAMLCATRPLEDIERELRTAARELELRGEPVESAFYGKHAADLDRIRAEILSRAQRLCDA